MWDQIVPLCGISEICEIIILYYISRCGVSHNIHSCNKTSSTHLNETLEKPTTVADCSTEKHFITPLQHHHLVKYAYKS